MDDPELIKYVMPPKNEADFAKQIVAAIQKGYAFVPFVGAGFSVASGIPATPQMNRYLEYCMLAAFGLVPERHNSPWAPRQEAWPKVASWSSDGMPTSGRIRDLWRRALTEHPGNQFLREAFGALADWRSSLRFLSRIDYVTPADSVGQPAKIHLGMSDPSIIDSFFRQLMENRRPALTHKMLHALSTALRADVLLTTNFDDLIERAFLDAGSLLTVYEVPSHDPLPTSSLVLRERTLVKLHGGKFWLRADDSLDEAPTRGDIRNFLGYLAGRPLRSEPNAVGDDLTVVNEATALLVCGLQAQEKRIQHLLAHALAWMPQLEIYWLGFTQSDYRSAVDLARCCGEFAQKRVELKDKVTQEQIRGRINVSLHPKSGLFFLRLFQDLSKALPPSGAIFPALWQLPSPPNFFGPLVNLEPMAPNSGRATHATPEEIKRNAETLLKKYNRIGQKTEEIRKYIRHNLTAYSRGDLQTPLPIVLLEVKKDPGGKDFSGGLYIAEQLHNERNWGGQTECGQGFSDPVRALWFDLDDIVQPAGFFLRLTLVIASACGETDPISRLNIQHYYGSHEDHMEFCQGIADSINLLTRESGAFWLITVNAKEEPGCNSHFRHENIDLNGHIQETENRWCDSEYATRFSDTISYLICKRRLPLQFIFVSYDTFSERSSHSSINALWTAFGAADQQKWTINDHYIDIGDSKSLARRARANVAIDQIKQPDGESTLRYLTAYLLAIFRIARYPVAIREILGRLLPYLKVDNREYDLSLPKGFQLDTFLGVELEKYQSDPRTGEPPGLGLIREKPGGFLWMHLQNRRDLLNELHEALDKSPQPVRQAIARLTLRAHWYVARWYGRLLLSSLDPLAIAQAVDHIFRGLEFAIAFQEDLFRKEDSPVRRLPTVMVRHARHILSVGDPLFGRRLSDQFANLALSALLTEGLDPLRKQFKKLKKPVPGVFHAILPELQKLELQLCRMYTTLQRRSGRFDEPDQVLSSRRNLLKKKPVLRANSRAASSRASLSDWRSIKLDLANSLLCSRHYTTARKELFKCLQDITERTFSMEGMESDEIVEKWRREILEWSIETREEGLGEAVQVLEKLMYLEMHESQSAYLARDSADKKVRPLADPSPERIVAFDKTLLRIRRDIKKRHRIKKPTMAPKEMRCAMLKRAKKWGDTGQALLRHIAINDGQRVYVDNVRLRAHAALCEALIAVNEKTLDRKARKLGLTLAKVILTEAQAYLDEFPLKHSGKLRAVFELRSAEIAILEASAALPSKPRSELFNLSQTVSMIIDSKTISWPEIGSAEAHSLEGGDLPLGIDSYRESLAYVYDALRGVRRAEIVLENHRKSRWWWWILLVLKIKACEYLYRIRLERLLAWSENNMTSKPEEARSKLTELTRQLPPFALNFLRDEITVKVTDTQLTDPLFLSRITHSFRRICELDFHFESAFAELWKAQVKVELPGGRTDRPRVRLSHARQSLRTLTERLGKVLRSFEKSRSQPNPTEPLGRLPIDEDAVDYIDGDTLDYAELVYEQARWTIDKDPVWKY
ncbi:MAG: hypothetical protein JWN70_3562 [Planctomycetaceae bacterium]|nr:hypothetical protein [Planctomycetaceae bacterium]